MAEYTFFTHEATGHYRPTPMAYSLWGADSLNGPAICGLAALAAETEHGRAGWRPARFTLELFKAARRLPTSTRTQVLRDGGRIRVVSVQVCQHDTGDENGGGADVVVAQGVVVFLKEGTDPPGARWQRPERDRTFFPPEVADDDTRPRFGGDEGWSTTMNGQQKAHRHRMWTQPLAVAPDHPLTPFQRAVIAGESTSLMTNWGEGGIGFINADLTVSLTRLPRGTRIGIEADTHLESGGISIGTAALYDEDGQFGVGGVTAVDNTRAMIDFEDTELKHLWSE